MANQTLRELAQAFAQGKLDKEAYRKARAELIQGIIAGTSPLQEIDYPPLVQPAEAETLDDTQRRNDTKKPAAEKAGPAAAERKTQTARAEPAKPEVAGPGKGLFIALAVIVAGLVLVLVLFLMQNASHQGSTAITNSTGMDNASAPAAALTTMTPAQKLLRDFLAKNNWSAASLDTLLQHWNTLSAEEIQASKDSLEMGQLTNAIYKQLLEEDALSGLVDDDSALLKQKKLVQFAADMGIDDARIKLPEAL